MSFGMFSRIDRGAGLPASGESAMDESLVGLKKLSFNYNERGVKNHRQWGYFLYWTLRRLKPSPLSLAYFNIYGQKNNGAQA
ncbi:hypothetical protein THMIRHAT_21580 [Thiosulfativibrio zosterae]|uniref:Uncharacterized protein n=1 Tax=Thiosulfativibrio zosterae TaxID=2675053 RepID=A0A6F8PQK6_9GAMM|nr:hypothetical protein THMIRHAT_21580 [Thiosulfativibrio zosterae]